MTAPYWSDDTVTLYAGDCLDVLPSLPDASVDAVVCDPPYGLTELSTAKVLQAIAAWMAGDRTHVPVGRGFMGREWDQFVPPPGVWDECMRILKPGGHLLAFAGARTVDLMTLSIRIAGFEIRESIFWTFGQGFPKSLSVHKATLSKVNSQYGPTERCNCLDAGNGRPARNDAGQGGSGPAWDSGGPGKVSAPEARHSDVPLHARAGDRAVCELWRAGDPPQQGGEALPAPVLLTDVRGCRTEEERFGDSSIRARLEEHPGEGSEAGQRLPVLRCFSQPGCCAACASPEAVPVQRDEPDDESGLAVRRVSSHDRGGDDFRPVLDPDRREPRRLHLDDHGGRHGAVAQVCSWCALPDREWLDSLKPLGSALKPAHEPIVLARKPLTGTVAATVLTHGTGALNIDGCRVGTDSTRRTNQAEMGYHGGNLAAVYRTGSDTGRWPTNVVLTHQPLLDDTGNIIGDACEHGCVPGCPVADLDAQSGVTASSSRPRRNTAEAHNRTASMGKSAADWTTGGHDDSGGASRYFPVFRYEAKAPSSERPRGEDGTAHATVKPLNLLRFLTRLVCQPGGLVLDPFLGSGTTAEACVIEGFRCIGIERDESHLPLIKARLAKPIQPTLGFEDAS